ncbi:helix-turn-helix domain-containing protein [Nocardia sp. NPDC127579]|uniref:helix-turn-helix domain-containing protein n=1 Tax=Nocardia sp. NPDC127579 TaxID=3345402 RepID=UPI003631B967
MNTRLARRRQALGLPAQEVARRLGIDETELHRYESGESEPTLSLAVELAAVLRIGLDELVATSTRQIDLTGAWWAAWQAHQDGEEIVTTQEVVLRHRGSHVELDTATPGVVADSGGFRWHGELRLWHSEILTGWYAADDDSPRSIGSMYFIVQPLGRSMIGRWTGLGNRGQLVDGAATMARDADAARTLLEVPNSDSANRQFTPIVEQ